MQKPKTTKAQTSVLANSPLETAVKEYTLLASDYETGIADLALWIVSKVAELEVSLNSFADLAQAESTSAFAKKATVKRLAQSAKIGDMVNAGKDPIVTTYQALNYGIKGADLATLAETASAGKTKADRGNAYETAVQPLIDSKRNAKRKPQTPGGETETEVAPDTETVAPVTASTKLAQILADLQAVKATELLPSDYDTLAKIAETVEALALANA